jgi:hypothetical protein
MFDFRKWFHKTFRIDSRMSNRLQLAGRRETQLRLEQLENRTVPTVVFQPQFGAKTVNPPVPNTNYTVLNDPEVYLHFWGPYWSDRDG